MGEDQRSRFFKIMMPGFEERLKLPPAFCEKLKHEKSKMAILKSRKGRWEINVRRDDDEDDQIFFEDGWPRFAAAHGLSIKDFLVFEHTGNLHFNVRVCDKNTACEKQFLVDVNDQGGYHEKRKVPLCKQSLCFSVKITPYTVKKKGRVNIPIELVKSNNLGKKKGAILKDPRRGRKWMVKLSVHKRPQFRVAIDGGWHYFAAANNLQVGDVCTFQLHPNSITTSTNISFDVHISRNINR